ncbi:MAG: prepilin-type N-terminal cleavage/methylation domain-containing protein [Phycisphaerae bacterium]|nr:prepilin-type N-terminal cleavage/methylation domain-containing protein [Phycisphaerae bacterium]
MMRFPKTKNHFTGFTYIELIVVISIIGILSAIATLSFTSIFTSTRLQYAADRLMSDLYLVRDQARREQTACTLNFDVEHLVYTASDVKDPSGVKPIEVHLDDVDFQITQLVFNRPGPTDVSFDAQGRANIRSIISLYSGDRYVSVQVSIGGEIEQVQ